MDRDLKPTPEAVFAMFHWHDQYAASGLGSMGFFDSLTDRQRRFCGDAIALILVAAVSPRSTREPK